MDVRELEDQAACLPLERLEAEITTLAGHLAAAECRWLLLVAEFDRREGWGQWGCLSASHWLGWKCGIELRAAQEKVRVARVLHKLPAIAEAFGKGELSYSQVRALTRVAEPSTEADLVEMARHATAAQLERIVRGFRRALRAEDETAAANARATTGATSLSPGTTTGRSCTGVAATRRRERCCWPPSRPSASVPRNVPRSTR